jgi:biotin transport system substrate-specific component
MQGNQSLAGLHLLVWTALMAALVAVGAYLQLPLGPVPFSLQVFFVLLSGFILGPVQGAMALILYAAAGLVGLPVFSGGKAGLAHILGPSGGYIIGFIFCAALSGLARVQPAEKLTWLGGLLWGGLGLAGLYVLGVARLMMVLQIDMAKALSIGFITFIPGDLVKLVLAVLVCRYLAQYRMLPR